MGYMLPLRFIKVSSKRTDQKQFDVSICATRVVAIMSTELYQARRAIHDEKKAGTLINACGQLAAKSAIFLDNGTVVSSPRSVSALMTSIEKSNQRDSAKRGPRLRMYDVFDEEPDPNEDEEIEELSAFSDEEFEDEEKEDEEEFEDEEFEDDDE